MYGTLRSLEMENNAQREHEKIHAIVKCHIYLRIALTELFRYHDTKTARKVVWVWNMW
jgi:hypothetical protein